MRDGKGILMNILVNYTVLYGYFPAVVRIMNHQLNKNLEFNRLDVAAARAARTDSAFGEMPNPSLYSS